MSEVNPEVEAFFTDAGTWRTELAALRIILHACPVSEEFKWRSPCYTAQGGNVATIWRFKDACGLGFFKGVLLKDPAGILIALGENSRSMRAIKFTSVRDIDDTAATLKAYVREAVAVEKAGLKVDFPKDDLEPPEELVEMLEKDPDLKAAFEALTPGRQRGYILHFSRPRQSKTRVSRIEKSAPGIFDGKGLNDR